MRAAYHVEVTTQAHKQIREIYRYVREELQAPDAAQHLLDALRASIAALERFPGSIALTDEEPWRSYGFRRMPVRNFLVYFWIDEAAGRVQVTSVVYGKRDQMRVLSQMNLK